MRESHRLIPVIDAALIRRTVRRLGRTIDREYKGKDPVVVCILKGSFIFCADLVRELSIPLEIDFIGVKSYGSSTRSSGFVRVTKELDVDVSGRHVLVVEDIADTGRTLRYLLGLLVDKHPASIRVCALVDKRRRGTDPPVDYLGFRLGKVFLVGYGLDYAERFRHLEGLYRISGVR